YLFQFRGLCREVHGFCCKGVIRSTIRERGRENRPSYDGLSGLFEQRFHLCFGGCACLFALSPSRVGLGCRIKGGLAAAHSLLGGFGDGLAGLLLRRGGGAADCLLGGFGDGLVSLLLRRGGGAADGLLGGFGHGLVDLLLRRGGGAADGLFGG